MVPPPPRRPAFDWSTVSIALSIMGALISIVTPGLVLLGLIVFVAGLSVGVLGWRRGVRKNRAAIGIILNSANLLVNVGLLTSAAPR